MLEPTAITQKFPDLRGNGPLPGMRQDHDLGRRELRLQPAEFQEVPYETRRRRLAATLGREQGLLDGWPPTRPWTG